MKSRLTKKQVKQLNAIADRLWKIAAQFDDDNDVELQISGNGTVSSNINCACASIDAILQEY